jgi:hypothetical protein
MTLQGYVALHMVPAGEGQAGKAFMHALPKYHGFAADPTLGVWVDSILNLHRWPTPVLVTVALMDLAYDLYEGDWDGPIPLYLEQIYLELKRRFSFPS